MANNSATPNYAVDYNDDRFTQVEADKNAALAQSNAAYQGMINQSDKYFNQQAGAVEDWGKKQTELQQERTEFAVEEIEREREEAKKDYIKEQSGAYADWKKQSNNYGVNAEKQAMQGMQGSGFSESSQVSMYNTYQNRVATAREVAKKIDADLVVAIKDARMQGDARLAEIAAQTQQTKLEILLEGFKYKNQLIIEKENKQLEIENQYYERWQDVLGQINQENALAEQIRQYEQNFAEEQRQYNQNYALQLKDFEEGIRQYDQNYALQLKELEEDIRQYDLSFAEQVRQYDASLAEKVREFDASLEEDMRQHNDDLAYKAAALAEEVRQYDADYALKLEELAEKARQYDASLLEEQRQFDIKTAISEMNSEDEKSDSDVTILDNNGELTEDGIQYILDAGNKAGLQMVGALGEAAGTLQLPDTSTKPTVNTESIGNLGQGRMSEDKILELMDAGLLIADERNGEVFFYWNPDKELTKDIAMKYGIKMSTAIAQGAGKNVVRLDSGHVVNSQTSVQPSTDSYSWANNGGTSLPSTAKKALQDAIKSGKIKIAK